MSHKCDDRNCPIVPCSMPHAGDSNCPYCPGGAHWTKELITYVDPMAVPINQEWHKFITELADLMDKVAVPHPRIKGLTLKEEWRMCAGYTPFDPDQDDEMWKNSYEALGYVDDKGNHLPWNNNEGPNYHLMMYKDYALRCGLDQGVMDLKYPRVAALFNSLSSIPTT
jgi:hypothetical protein